mmetsp:Transcript_1279/g.2750  ORF Transcript_1279/g.2750 Transcript_1279/m.2750 type:complete len:248 (+) Transcript_1279:154-897(+)
MPRCVPPGLVWRVDVVRPVLGLLILPHWHEGLIPQARVPPPKGKISTSSAPVTLHSSSCKCLLCIAHELCPECGVTLELRAEVEAMLRARFAALHHRPTASVGLVVLEDVNCELSAPLRLWPGVESLAGDGLHAEVAGAREEEAREHVPCTGHVPRVNREVELPVGRPVILCVLGQPVDTAALRAQAQKAAGVEDLVLHRAVGPHQAGSHDLRLLLDRLPSERVRLCRGGQLPAPHALGPPLSRSAR